MYDQMLTITRLPFGGHSDRPVSCVEIQALHPTSEARPVVLLVEQHDLKIGGWTLRHSRHYPALMFRERALQPLARRRRIDQGVEEGGPVPVGQDERLMFRNRPPGGVREGRHAEIRHLAPLELGSPFDQSLGRLVDAETEPLGPNPLIPLC